MLPPLLFLDTMVHFNELYVTEDGKNLVIDAEIDDFPVYNGAYIEKITVNTAANYCAGNNDAAATVYSGGDSVLYVDINGDAVIDEADMFIIDWLNKILSRKTTDPDYDVNMDGKVNLADVSAVLSVILGTNKDETIMQRANVNKDDQINIGDVNSVVNAILGDMSWFEANLPEDVYHKIFGRDFADGSHEDGWYDIWRSKQNAGVFGQGSRHVRKCLDKNDLVLALRGSSINDNLFIITVTANINGNAEELAELGCGWDNNVIRGAAYNSYPLYKTFMDMAGRYSDACDNSNSAAMADYILNYYALDFALRMGDWCTALGYWKELLSSGTGAGVVSGRGCGCRGTR